MGGDDMSAGVRRAAETDLPSNGWAIQLLAVAGQPFGVPYVCPRGKFVSAARLIRCARHVTIAFAPFPLAPMPI